ncbi:MAG: hypothetical protein U1E59_00290 [Amaricoccus sp.]
MPTVEQYTFTYREILEALVKIAKIHDGKWQLTMTFGLSPLNAGPSEDEVVPAAVLGVQSLGLVKATDTSPPALVIDASQANPAT